LPCGFVVRITNHLSVPDDVFSLAVRGRNVLVTGDAKSGKSWVAGLLCEQLILHGYCVCAIDPEGDYSSLEGLPGVTVLGREDAAPTPRELLRRSDIRTAAWFSTCRGSRTMRSCSTYGRSSRH
jgi:hypothetical protein